MRRFGLLLFCCLCCWLATPNLVAATSSQLQQAKAEFSKALASYKSSYASYDRQRQLYARTNSQEHLAGTLSGAKTTFIARNQTMIAFNLYLGSLLDYYTLGGEKQRTSSIKANLKQELASYQNLDANFSARDGLYKSDDDFARLNASGSETIFRAFALIYYSEVKAILDDYTNLYLQQQSRILQEAKNEVDKGQKEKILAQTKRSLTTIKENLAQVEPLLDKVNSREQYFNLKNKINPVVSEMEASLKLYASLE